MNIPGSRFSVFSIAKRFSFKLQGAVLSVAAIIAFGAVPRSLSAYDGSAESPGTESRIDSVANKSSARALQIELALARLSRGASDEKIIDVCKRAAEAQEKYDPSTLEKLYAADYVEISPKGEIDVREKAIGFYKVENAEELRAKTPRYVLDEFKVRNYGKFAMVIAKFSFGSREDPSKPPMPVGLVLYALRKEKGVWKIYSAQFTPFPRPAKT
ncbi:MAG: nuclear transport factor 2 family protein [Pyrinomonadaceae bacterium]